MTMVTSRATAAEFAALNPVLHKGEPGLEKDTGRLKFGNGVTAWNVLPYAAVSGAPITKRALGKFYAGLANRLVEPARVVCIGSSTTEGAGASAPELRYVNRLATSIQAAYPSGTGTEAPVVFMQAGIGTVSNTPGVHVYNGGVGGSTTANYLTQYTDIQVSPIAAMDPRLIIHMVGSNDYAVGTAPSVAAANISAKIAEFKAATTGPTAHLVIATYSRYDVVSPAYPWLDYIAAFKALSTGDPDNVAFIDIHEAYDLADAGGADPLDLMQVDRIHQTDAGYALMADLIRVELGISFATTQAIAGAGITAPGLRVTSDSFSGADTTALTARATDVAYSGTAVTPAESAAGAFSIVSNQLVIAPSQAFLGYPVTAQDAEISAIVVTPPATGSVYLNSRRNTLTGATYQARAVLGQGTVRLEINGGAVGDKYPYKAGDRVGVRSKGSSHSLTINGNLVNQATATVLNSTYAGVASFTTGGSSAVLDDMLITAV